MYPGMYLVSCRCVCVYFSNTFSCITSVDLYIVCTSVTSGTKFGWVQRKYPCTFVSDVYIAFDHSAVRRVK